MITESSPRRQFNDGIDAVGWRLLYLKVVLLEKCDA